MKAIKLLLLAFVLVGPVWATKPADTVTGPETTVNAAALYVDSVFGNALAMLELVAATPEARGGDWNGIKRYLQQAEASLPGVYFYVLPNGNYYSVALDYTNLNLGNRGYFKSLFEGNAIKGFPVYSRSSGKKSAVVAVPIVVGGKVSGALAKQIEKSRPNIGQADEIRKLLSTFINENLDVVDVSFVDGQGVLRLIEPSEYKNFENADVSKREHVAALLKSRKPIFSSAFRAFEGFLAVELSHPLHDARRSFLGSINAFIRPELLIEPLLSKSHIPDDYELWIMQPDGMIVFDQDSEEIGRMLFSDPLYAGYGSLLEMGRKIAASPDGKGSYIFLAPASREKVVKEMVWQTVRLHGREWRVILAYRPYE